MTKGGANGGKSASSVQPPDIAGSSGSEKLLQPEQPLTGQGDAANLKPPAEAKPIISDATSPKGDNLNGNPNPSFNTSAGAPAPENNTPVNDKLSTSNKLATSNKGANSNVSPTPSLNTFAGASLPSSSDGPAPSGSGSG
jgi:hypothetical protein